MKKYKIVSCREVKPLYWSLINKRLFASHRRPLEASGAVNESSQQIAHCEVKEEELEEEEEGEEEEEDEEEGTFRSPNDSQCNT